MIRRAKFSEIFRVNVDDSIEPIRSVQIGAIRLGPGARFGRGVAFSGIDLAQYAGRDLEIDEQTGFVILRGIY